MLFNKLNLKFPLGKSQGASVNYVTLPQNLDIGDGDLIEGFETAGDWTLVVGVGNGNFAANTSEKKQGTQSIKMTHTTNGTNTAIQKTVAGGFATPKYMELWVYLHTASSTLSQIVFYFATDATFAKYFAYTVSGATLSAGWNLVRMTQGAAGWSSSGSPSWTTDTFTVFRIRQYSVAGNMLIVSYDQLQEHDYYPAVLVNFDDVRSSVYTAGFSYMQTKNIVGTAYMVSDLIDTAGYLTSAQLLEMDAAGWIIGNHSKDHTLLTTLSQADVTTNVGACKTALEALGLTRGSMYLAYPNGGYSATVRAGVIAAGILTGRSGTGAQVIPLMDMYQLQSQQGDSTHDLVAVKAYIDNALTNGDVTQVLFHDLVASPVQAYDWAIADFQTVMDYIISQQIVPITIDNLYDLQSGPVTVVQPW